MGIFGGSDVKTEKTNDPSCAVKVSQTDKGKETVACVDDKMHVTSVTVKDTGTATGNIANALKGGMAGNGAAPQTTTLKTNEEMVRELVGMDKDFLKTLAKHAISVDDGSPAHAVAIADVQKGKGAGKVAQR